MTTNQKKERQNGIEHLRKEIAATELKIESLEDETPTARITAQIKWEYQEILDRLDEMKGLYEELRDAAK